MALPILAQYPPETVRTQLPPEEWQACLDGWILSIQFRLRMTESAFSELPATEAGVPFLLSYLPRSEDLSLPLPGSRDSLLRHDCYFLLKRFLLTSNADILAPDLFSLISSASLLFAQSSDLKQTLKLAWKQKQAQIKKAVELEKAAISSSEISVPHLKKLTALTRCLPEVAIVIMAGADYLDGLMNAYIYAEPDLRLAITANIFYSFMALLSTKHISLLLDNLYHMKSEADRLQKAKPASATLLSSLVCSTSFLRHLRSDVEMARRQQGMVDYLSGYRQSMLHLHPLPQKIRRKSKGKGKERQSEDMHMHQAARISQVHELFPDLNVDYIMKLLDHFSDNVENVIAALLEPSSLPSYLQDQSPDDIGNEWLQAPPNDLAHKSTPLMPAERKNVFDDDDFDRLRISSNTIRRGKKDIKMDEPKSSEEHARSKTAIMAALATFDADDDERDDTYDVADVGGAVDNTLDTDERSSSNEKNEATLYKAWKETPEIFARDSTTRMSNIRQQLKRETGMTDEQIEGWAVMLKRDPKMEDRLQKKHAVERTFRGNQKSLQSTKWTGNVSTENSEAESGAEASGNDTKRIGQAGIRGHRSFGGGRGRGGSVSAPSDSGDTQAARKRKEQGRGRGGPNHHRRDARAKKMGRGMAAPIS